MKQNETSSAYSSNPSNHEGHGVKQNTHSPEHHKKRTRSLENDIPPINPPTEHHPTEEQQWYTEQKRFWERQIRTAKYMNGITFLAAGVGLFGLVILYGTHESTRDAANAAKASFSGFRTDF